MKEQDAGAGQFTFSQYSESYPAFVPNFQIPGAVVSEKCLTETRNMSIRHRCPHPGAILAQKQVFCKKKKKKKKKKKNNQKGRLYPKSNLTYIL